MNEKYEHWRDIANCSEFVRSDIIIEIVDALESAETLLEIATEALKKRATGNALANPESVIEYISRKKETE